MAENDDLKLYGDGPVNANGQVTIPADARREIGIAPRTRVIFFGQPESGQLIVMPAPPAKDLVAFVAEHAKRQQPRS